LTAGKDHENAGKKSDSMSGLPDKKAVWSPRNYRRVKEQVLENDFLSQCPPRDHQSYSNYLVAVSASHNDCEFNFHFKNGQHTKQKEDRELQMLIIKKPRAIRKIVVFHRGTASGHIDRQCYGFQFYSDSGELLLETNPHFCTREYQRQVTKLSESERIVGVVFKTMSTKFAYYSEL
jgi:hypothetical protein